MKQNLLSNKVNNETDDELLENALLEERSLIKV